MLFVTREQRISEKFIGIVYWNILLDSNHRFGVDFVVHEQTPNELFKPTFYSNILLIVERNSRDTDIDENETGNAGFVDGKVHWNILLQSKQILGVDFVMHEQARNE